MKIYDIIAANKKNRPASYFTGNEKSSLKASLKL